MSLLDSDDDPYADPYAEDEVVLRSHTGESLFADTTHRSKARRSRAEERRGSKPLHWSKQKENVVQEKTPKKGKVQSSAKPSVSRTPPDSPKGSRPEVKGVKVGVAVGAASPGLLPSPNVKSQRKCYSQLEAGPSSSSEEDLAAKEGSLFSNKPALRNEGNIADNAGNPLVTPSNPFLDDRPLVPGATYTTPVLAPPMFPMGAAAVFAAEEVWLPTAHSTADTNHPVFPPELSSPVRHTPSKVTGAANPLLMTGGLFGSPPKDGEMGGLFGSPPNDELFGSPPKDGKMGGLFGSPPKGGEDLPHTNPFLSINQYPAMGPIFTPPSTTALPTSYSPEPSSPKSPSPPVVAEDWTISEDLHSKCVQQFSSLEPVRGLLQGDKAREFFVQSKLPNQELSAIW